VSNLRKRDPIPKLAALMKSRGLMSNGEEEAIVARARQRVADAFAFARQSDYPAPQDALNDVFV
jgi:pyruvate dehydrogenase E1 component alpha subunit